MNNIFEVINNSNSIALFGHKNPDGDAIGSVLSFYEVLTNMNKNVDMIMTNIPPIFSYLHNIDKIKETSRKQYDLAIVLDCANKERIGQVGDVFSNCSKSIAIDHHVTNTRFCDINYVVDDAPACCQVVYYLLKDNGIAINKFIGEDIATGVLTDTGGFRNNNVDAKTYMLASELVNIGIDIHKIYNDVLCIKTKNQQELLKMTCDRLEYFCDGKIAFSYISHEDMENIGAKEGDHEGLVDVGRNVLGVVVSVFMREDDGYRVSFRSNGQVNVNEIASVFGGGGHLMAAGAKINMSFKDTKETVIREITKVINNE